LIVSCLAFRRTTNAAKTRAAMGRPTASYFVDGKLFQGSNVFLGLFEHMSAEHAKGADADE